VAHLVVGWWVRIGLLLAAVLGSTAELRLPVGRLHLPVLLLEMRRPLPILLLRLLLHVLGRVILPAELLLVLLLGRLAERRLLELLWLRRPLLLLLLRRAAWLTAKWLGPTRLAPGLSKWLEPASTLITTGNQAGQ